MTIAILVWSRIWGGLESHAVDLVNAAVDAGHDVTLACVGSETAALYRARNLRATIEATDPPPSTVTGWYRYFRSLRCDVCLFEKGTLHVGSLALDVAARLAFRAFVVIQQLEPPVLGPRTASKHLGGMVPGLGLWWYRQRTRGWLRSLMPVRTICISESVRSALSRGYGFATRKMPIIPNGVDTVRFSPGPAVKARATGGTVIVATAARLVQEKGIDVALRGFARALASSPVPMELHIANDGAERQALEALTDALGIREHVRFLGFQRDLTAFYRGVDIFLVPSRIEAQGLIVLEALSSGCLVVASSVGGIPEMITRPELGILVPADDPEAIAEAILTLSRLPADDRQARNAAGVKYVADHFDSRTQCGAILSLVQQLSGGA